LLEPRTIVAVLKAAAEPTRLRILLLLATGDLNVKDLTRVLGQSQPRISRHLKLLAEAGLIERSREGSWVYFHLTTEPSRARLLRQLLDGVDPADQTVQRDRTRAAALKADREAAAQDYFRQHAAEWDKIRALHIPEADVERAMREMLATQPIDLLVDLGTGTGRVLELFAGSYDRAIGFDANNAMLAYARSRLGKAAAPNAQVRNGDIYDVQLPDRSAGAVVMHQVLHFLSDTAGAIREATRLLEPGGRLLIADFAPHELEYLRDEFAHARLGFARSLIEQLMTDAGLVAAGYRELDPATSGDAGCAGDKLIVSLWLGIKPEVGRGIGQGPRGRSREQAA
jgi:ArsR family transcriptional regulator